MSELARYHQRERKRLISGWKSKVAFGALVSLLLAGGFLVVVVSKGTNWNMPVRIVGIQGITSIVNTALTAVVVIATCVYAWLTRATLSELVEGRRISRRPIIVLTIEDPQLKDHQFSSDDSSRWMDLKGKLIIANYGSVPAIRFGCQLLLPNQQPAFPKTEWIANSNLTSPSPIPKMLLPGTCVTSEINGYLPRFEVPEGRSFVFMELHLWFEDADRNVYKMVHCYDLFKIGLEHLSWILSYEALFTAPVQAHGTIDTAAEFENAAMQGKMQTLYQRAGYLPGEAWLPGKAARSHGGSNR